jgi:hypothetical protein
MGTALAMSMQNVDHRLSSMSATVAGMRVILLDQTRQLDLCLHILHESELGPEPLDASSPDINRVIKAIMHMIGISAHSLLKLCEEVNLSAKDGYPIARAIIEGAVNVAYLMASDPEILRKAQRHAEFRAFRDLNRQENMGGWTMQAGYQIELPAHQLERLDSMASEFTTAKGRDKDWTELSIRQRLDAAAAVFKSTSLVSLNVAAFNIYRHASEVIHGSYYGALMIYGMNIPRSGKPNGDEFRLVFLDHQFSVLMTAIFAVAGLVECFAQYAKIPALKLEVDEIIRRLSTLPAVAESLNEQLQANAT